MKQIEKILPNIKIVEVNEIQFNQPESTLTIKEWNDFCWLSAGQVVYKLSNLYYANINDGMILYEDKKERVDKK